MMTAVEETGGCVPLSELVTGVTTRQCCRWVSPHTTHTSTHSHTVGGEVGYTTTTHTSVTQCFEHCTRWGRHQWCGVCVRASSATLQHGIVPTNPPFLPLPSAPPLQLPSQTEHIQSPQEVTLEEDGQPSAVVIVTTKGLTKIG